MTPHPFLLVLLASVLIPTAPAHAQKKIRLGPEQKVAGWGYSIRILEDWQAIAIKPEEKFTVGHWKLNTDQLRLRGLYKEYEAGSYCDLQIIRIATQVLTGKTKTPEEIEREKAEEEQIKRFPDLVRRLRPKSFDDWLAGAFKDCDKRWVRTPLKTKDLEGELIEFGSGAEAYTIALFKRDGVEWGVVYTSFEEANSIYRDWYLKSIDTFELFEADSTDAAAMARKDPNKLKGEEKRAALHASIAASPGWYAIDTDHYVFLSNSDNRKFIQQIAKEIEVVRAKVYTKLFPPRNKEQALSPVRVCDTESEYYQYGGPRGSAGYFSPDSGELVLFTKFEDVTSTNSLNYCRSVMYHEAFHQYIHYAVGDVSPHSWFNEGHGDFFAGMKVRGSSIKFDTFDWRVDYLKQHLREKRDLIPLRTLIRLPQSEYYTNAGLKYSEGWALIYYLRNVTRRKSEQKILDIYFNYLADHVEAFRAKKKEKGKDDGEKVPGIPGIEVIDWEDAKKVQEILSAAVDKAFDGIDIDKLEKDFLRWVERL
ncbi:MAG: hypothetical protein Fur0037_09630 [Planctomycetota bacterium]